MSRMVGVLDAVVDGPYGVALTRDARLVYLEIRNWLGRHNTNTFGPHALDRITDSPNPLAAVDELVAVGLLRPDHRRLGGQGDSPMTWVRLDDTFAEDPRLERAGPLALALNVAALCYCSRLMTDGAIPRSVARRLLELDDVDAVVGRLVAEHMWEATDDGWRILDYLKTQPSRAHVEQVRTKRAAAGRNGGKQSGASRRNKAEANANQNASPVASTMSNPVPSRRDTGRLPTCPHGRTAARERETGEPVCAECAGIIPPAAAAS